MLLLLKPDLPAASLTALLEKIRALGLPAAVRENLLAPGRHAIVIAAPVGPDLAASLALYRGVDKAIETDEANPLVARGARPLTAVDVGGVVIGPGTLCVIGGPCAVESLDMLLATARRVRGAGGGLLRAGAFKPRTSPYSFQGLKSEGIEILVEVRRQTGLPFVTEILDPRDVGFVSEHADMLQVGSRNQQNFPLLKEVGKVKRPVLLKRGMACTLKELLLAAEYVLEQGNDQVVLCERGVRGFDPSARNLLDLAAVPALRERTHLPVIVDPSHGTGRRELVPAMAKAAVAAGADGVMIEVHKNPETARSDGRQALTPAEFEALVPMLLAHARLEGREPAVPASERHAPERAADRSTTVAHVRAAGEAG